ncbi:hypothetical protein [Nocardia vinacea]|uniref:hypothetical protein n=1 Tax=Nocardia vinacea TaxID=96468 RepID=UPI0002EFEB1C|nr:hypothetical protein [Nocardia vinacea]
MSLRPHRRHHRHEARPVAHRPIDPYGHQIELLATIPGVRPTIVEVVLAEIGAGITQFPSAGI